MQKFDGFPKNSKFLPVPSPLLSSLLAEIEDAAELRCTLRFLWYAGQVVGSPKWVRKITLLEDGILREIIGAASDIESALQLAVRRGTLLEINGTYLLKTPENAAAISKSAPSYGYEHPSEPRSNNIPNIYTLYETNIGVLTPMIAERLRDAEETYPPIWIESAIRQAAERNVHNWRYISAILERWKIDGPNPLTERKGKRGELRGYPETASAAEYVRQRQSST